MSDDDVKRLYEVIVTHYESPEAIFIRNNELEARWRHQESQIETMLLKAPRVRIPLEKLSVGQPVIAKVRTLIYRAVVLAIHDQTKTVDVRLLDSGKKATVGGDDLKRMPENLRRLNAFCVCIRIHGVSPTAGAEEDEHEWSICAHELIQEIINTEYRLYVRQKGKLFQDKGEGQKKINAEVYVKRHESKCALEQTSQRYVSLADMLVEKGLAVGLNMNMAPESPSNIEDVFSTCDSMMVESEVSECLDELEKVSWPPPQLPQSGKFEGRVTYIDDEGQIYVQPQTRVADAMAVVLSRKHEQMQLCHDDLYWEVGDKLIAKYPHLALGWFRGLVVQVKPDSQLRVLFVDYGECKVVCPANNECHKATMFDNIPVQVLRCKLDNVIPVGGKYMTRFLDSVHRLIVDKSVHVWITRPSCKKFPLPVILHLLDQDRLNIARYFVKHNAAQKMSCKADWKAPDAVLRQNELAFNIQPVVSHNDDDVSHLYGQSVSDLESAVVIMAQQEDTNMYRLHRQFDHVVPVSLICTVGTNGIFVQYELPEDEEDQDHEYLQYVTSTRDTFDLMSRDLGDIAKLQPQLFTPTSGVPCLALYEDDCTWYRATLLDVLEEEAKVLYVDYGNVELVSLENLREIPWSCMLLPALAMIVVLEWVKDDDKEAFIEIVKKLQQHQLGIATNLENARELQIKINGEYQLARSVLLETEGKEEDAVSNVKNLSLLDTGDTEEDAISNVKNLSLNVLLDTDDKEEDAVSNVKNLTL